MEKDKFVLIHNDERIYRFKSLEEAKTFGACCCRGSYNYYAIIDMERNVVVYKWID